MKTIRKNLTSQTVIERSIFICHLIKVEKKEEIKNILEEIKKKYKDATHCCYAYAIDQEKKSSDDKEPAGTAGIPMLEVLNQLQLNHVLAIVIRYFGGIKLGRSGLVRAYRNAVLQTISKEDIVSLVPGFHLTLEIEYSRQKELENLIQGNYQKTYQEHVFYQIEATKEEKEMLEKCFPILKIEEALIER